MNYLTPLKYGSILLCLVLFRSIFGIKLCRNEEKIEEYDVGLRKCRRSIILYFKIYLLYKSIYNFELLFSFKAKNRSFYIVNEMLIVLIKISCNAS